MRLILLVAAATSLAASGCTHHQLRRSAVGQVGTVADIYQQQVLNNLAKFAHDPNALPDFGVPTDGLAQVDDGVNFNNDWTWALLGGETGVFKLGADRGIRQSWSLTPVQDPRKLELMRCAYRKAVGFAECSECCPECEKRFAHFYTGKICEEIPGPCLGCPPNSEGCPCNEAPGIDPETQKKDTGIITSRCLESCWFHVGCADCADEIKKNNPCCLMGEHCGTLVWVTPGRGSEQLTRLTIAILDYAVNDPKELAAPATKEVTGYFNSKGSLADSRESAVLVIKANLPVTQGSKDQAIEAAGNLENLLLGEPASADDAVNVETSSAAEEVKAESSNKKSNDSTARQKLFQLVPELAE